jgi:hypothetical protein
MLMTDENTSTQADPSETDAVSTETAAENETETATADAASESSQEDTASEGAATDTAAAETPAEPVQSSGSEEGAAETAGDVSRTGFVPKGRPGDECICPDGRKGTIFGNEDRLVCIPNHDQG